MKLHALLPACMLTVAAPAAAQMTAAPGQFEHDFDRWVADPATAGRVAAFADYLKQNGVEGVLPTRHILRTAYKWQQCGATPFAVPPHELWPNIVGTLRLIREEVVPAIGEVEALSGYRDDRLNPCADGAPSSAHRPFYALDLVPKSDLSRDSLIQRLCQAHARHGPRWRWGLGFYADRRFHVDSLRFRRWGKKGQPSPCVAYDVLPAPAFTSRRPAD